MPQFPSPHLDIPGLGQGSGPGISINEYRDLLVRVAGYSDYFVDLDKYHQEEIISRTQHESF